MVAGVLDADAVAKTTRALERVQRLIRESYGEQALNACGDACVVRLPMKFDRQFLSLLETPQMLDVVDDYLSPAAVLRFQVGVLYPPNTPLESRPANGNFHRNFPHLESTRPVAVDAALLLSDMTSRGAPLYVVPASHRPGVEPSVEALAREERMLAAPAGSMIVVDGALWHREADVSDEPSVFVSHQFTHPLIKPHFDYARALGDDVMSSLSDRCRHLLGWNFRLPGGLGDFYKPEHERPFRSSRLRGSADRR